MKQHTINLSSDAILHIYIQDGGQKDGRALLVLPGGGYTYHEAREKEPIALAYLAKGYQVFILDYALTTPLSWDVVWNSSQDAMQVLYDKQQAWNFTFSKLAIIGFSAGGHLALMMATQGILKPCATIVCYPLVLDSLTNLISSELQGVTKYINEKTPPVFVFSTYEDHTVPIRHTLALLTALMSHHVPFESHIFQWGHHGLSLAKSWTADGSDNNVDNHAAHWFELSIEWLERLYTEKDILPENRTGTIDKLLSQKDTAIQVYAEFPQLKDCELLEAFGHFTPDELRQKFKNMNIK